MRKSLTLLALALLCSSITSCSRLHADPNAGAETVFLRTLDHADDFDIEYLRKPDEGPLRLRRNAWTYLWFLPVNHPDLGLWLRETIPADAEAANVRSNSQLPWYGPLVSVPTIGLIAVRRVEFEAQPVRYINRRPMGEQSTSK